MVFWILVTIMILVVLALLLRPLLRGAPPPAADDGHLNRSVYRQQLRELEADFERGLVTEDQLEQARMDIERALLSELPAPSPEETPPAARAGRLAPLLVALLVIAVSVPAYLYLGHPRALEPGGGEAPPSMEALIAQLERRLADNPDDTQGWLMLAQAYSSQDRHREAADVLGRLREQLGDQPGLLVRQANALAMANGGRFQGRPLELIRRVLAQDPDHPSATWFAGLAASQRGDYAGAVAYWQRLLPQLQGEPEALERLQGLIAQAQNAMRETGVGNGKGSENGPATTLTVRVSLAGELEDRVRADDTLYVFARAADGPAMPLAVVRRRAGELPLEVRLDDSDAMSPAGRLSLHDSVTLVARVSRSGDAQAHSGDLQGKKTDVALPLEGPVQLIIDSVVP